jgi:hypothetical protein
MDCDQFLEGYSSYLDERIAPGERRRFVEHMDDCSSCARYDRVMRRGLEVVRDLPEAEPSPDFLPRLRHRLYHIKDGIPLDSARGGSAALVAVAAVGFLALAWMPFATRVPVEVELPPVAVEAPVEAADREVPSLFQPGPFLDRGTASGAWRGSRGWLQGASAGGDAGAATAPSSFVVSIGGVAPGRR